MAVYTTAGPRDGSETARNIHDALRKCPHHQRSAVEVERDGQGAAALAWVELGRAQSLINAAEELQAKEAALSVADQAIEAAIRGLDQPDVPVNALEQEASDFEARAHYHDTLALRAAYQGGIDRWPPADGIAELRRLAAQALNKAKAHTEKAVPSEQATLDNAISAVEALEAFTGLNPEQD